MNQNASFDNHKTSSSQTSSANSGSHTLPEMSGSRHFPVWLPVLYTVAFLLLLLLLHWRMDYISDDARIAEQFPDNSFMAYLHFCLTDGSGRYLTDPLGMIFHILPMWVWKIFDCAIYLFIADMLHRLITKKDQQSPLFAGLMVLLFPFYWLKSAGYIMTSTNYVYTTCGILAALTPVILTRRGEPVSRFRKIAGLIGAVYAGSQEQSAVCLLLLLAGVYLIGRVTKETEETGVRPLSPSPAFPNISRPSSGRRQGSDPCLPPRGLDLCLRFLLLYAAAVLASLICMLLTPAHVLRADAQLRGDFAIPGYETWSIFYKAVRGISSTFSGLFWQPNLYYALFTVLLAACGIACTRGIKKWIAVCPLVLYAAATLSRFRLFAQHPDYGFGLTDLITEEHVSLAGLILSVLICAAVIVSVAGIIRKRSDSAIFCILLATGFLSRFVMGFSSSLFGSSYRTFIFLAFAILACNMLLYRELLRQGPPIWLLRLVQILTVLLTLASFGVSFLGTIMALGGLT